MADRGRAAGRTESGITGLHLHLSNPETEPESLDHILPLSCILEIPYLVLKAYA
jgi:hypothetical protein